MPGACVGAAGSAPGAGAIHLRHDPWLLYDFRSERRQTVFNQGFNRTGLIAKDKTTRKLAIEVLRAFYTDKLMNPATGSLAYNK